MSTQTPSTTITPELPPRYEAAAVQAEVAEVWERENAFHAEPDRSKEPFSIVIPPPNVTAALHLGHALNNTIQDILVRHARMQGKNAVWIPGTDHAGIATQTVVDKRLQAEGKPALKDYKTMEANGQNGREQFIEKVQAWKDEYEARILAQLKAMGCSCDFDRTAFTMDEPRARAVREAFFRLFEDGLIYRGKRLVNWDPVSQTALADDEVENEEIDGHFYYLKYPLVGSDETVTVATTRPETMLGDTAVAINPNDPRAASLRGRKVLLPIVNREIPIVEDEYVVMPANEEDPKAKFATGFLKVTPAHDPNDWDIGQRHGLEVINIMAPDASISDKHGWSPETPDAQQFVGLSREEARKAVVKWFKDHGLLEEIKPYRHSVGHSYRSHVPVEPYLSDQWYVAVQKPIPWLPDEGTVEGTDVPKNSLAGLALTALGPDATPPATPNLSDDVLRFVPDRYAKTYWQWNAALRDWCISRQLWWGHRIPVWTRTVDQGAGATTSREASSDPLAIQNGAEPLPVGMYGRTIPAADSTSALQLLSSRTDEAFDPSLNYAQDPDVLDTWFSSALWPMSTLGWPERTAALEAWNPTSVLCTAREIITLWVSRMVMFNRYMLAHPGEGGRVGTAHHPEPEVGRAHPTDGPIPFQTVFIHAMIQDGFGQKMSKSLGNGVDPLDVIHSHGADAMRFTLCGMTTHTQDVRLPVDLVDPHTGDTFTPQTFTNKAGYTVFKPIQEYKGRKSVSPYGVASGEAFPTPDLPAAKTTSAKFDLGRNFCNKLWNAGRYVISNLKAHHGGTEARSEEKDLSVVDRWILSRLSATVDAVNEALSEYRFDRYASACYDFFWRDFCDWYVEASKPRMAMRGPEADQTARVLATCLDVSLRLMQPLVPFATERLWWALNEAMPTRGLDGVPCPQSERCITAAWPTASVQDDEAENEVDQIQEVVEAIRRVRADHKVPPRQTVPVAVENDLDGASRAALELWAGCELQSKSELSDFVETSAVGAAILVGGVVDKAADAERIAKERADLEKQIKTLRGRLANKGYTDKAPPHLVQQTRDQLATAEAELAKL